ncbi:hypothetical protein [Sphingomonas sp.]|uniref:hypothetical protein n=1 Tax=Sphingomonas sp. TaxID=28214 RepID=UPI003B3B091B
MPFETRWAQDQRRIRFLPALDGAIRAVPLMVVAYDPKLAQDRRHAELIKAEAAVRVLPLPFAGHPVGTFLNDAGLLDPLVQAVLHGDFDPMRFAAAARDARRTSPQWLSQLASAQPAWRPATSVALAERAARLAPERPPILNALALRLAAAGRFGEAVATHHRVLSIEPVVDYAWSLCKTLHASGDLPGALGVARRLQNDAPRAAGYHAWAAKLQSLMGDKEGELRDLRRALALDPSNTVYRLVVLKLIWQLRVRRLLRIGRRR